MDRKSWTVGEREVVYTCMNNVGMSDDRDVTSKKERKKEHEPLSVQPDPIISLQVLLTRTMDDT